MENKHDCKQPFYKSRNFIVAIMLIVTAITGGTIDYTGVLGERIIFTGGQTVDEPIEPAGIENLPGPIAEEVRALEEAENPPPSKILSDPPDPI